MIAQLQAWVDFLALNSEKLVACVLLTLSVIGLIRAQIKLWRSERAGSAVTKAVTASGSEEAVRREMDTAPAGIKRTVRGWITRR